MKIALNIALLLMAAKSVVRQIVVGRKMLVGNISTLLPVLRTLSTSIVRMNRYSAIFDFRLKDVESDGLKREQHDFNSLSPSAVGIRDRF